MLALFLPNLEHLKLRIFQSSFPYLKLANPVSLSKVSNPNNKIRQTVGPIIKNYRDAGTVVMTRRTTTQATEEPSRAKPPR
jgi:hypothetical protein